MREFVLVFPEIILVLTLSGLIACEIAYQGERVRLVSGIALMGLAAAFVQTFIGERYLRSAAPVGSLAVDGLSVFFRQFFIVLAFLVVLLSTFTKEILPRQRTEYFAFLIASALAMCLAVSAADFMVIFLSLQFVNILGYFMAGYSKNKVISTEAAVKFMIFGVVSSVVFLYAVAVLFSVAGTLNIYEIPSVLAGQPASFQTSLLVIILMFLSLCFYLGVFPLHLWVPDVIQGVPMPTAAFFSLGLPAVGFGVGLRLFLVVFSSKGMEGQAVWSFFGNGGWMSVAALASGVTMLMGAVLAFRQVSAKRMLACLNVSQLGLMLTGLLVLNENAISAILYNLVVNLFSLVGIFCALSFLYDRVGSDRLKDFDGALPRAIPECVCLILFLACFVGFPPFPGFLGRFLLIGAVVREKWYLLAMLATLSTVISVGAFARFTFSLSGDFRSSGRAVALPRAAVAQRAFLFLLLIPVVLLSILADPAIEWAGRALRFQLW